MLPIHPSKSSNAICISHHNNVIPLEIIQGTFVRQNHHLSEPPFSPANPTAINVQSIQFNPQLCVDLSLYPGPNQHNISHALPSPKTYLHQSSKSNASKSFGSVWTWVYHHERSWVINKPSFVSRTSFRSICISHQSPKYPALCWPESLSWSNLQNIPMLRNWTITHQSPKHPTHPWAMCLYTGPITIIFHMI